jgi:hypothetical protein
VHIGISNTACAYAGKIYITVPYDALTCCVKPRTLREKVASWLEFESNVRKIGDRGKRVVRKIRNSYSKLGFCSNEK